MRNSKQILLAIFLLASVVSCNKDENTPIVALEKATISAKWIVGNVSDYVSFEFNESGNYIVVENTTTSLTNGHTIIFGNYEIVNNNTVVLSDFGTLTVSGINKNSISFSIQLTGNPDNEININASKQQEMASSERTDLLCKTWELVTVNGGSVVGTAYNLTVLFSKAGTYLVVYKDPKDGIDDLAQWKWKDEAETQLLYSREEVPVWDEADFVVIDEITSNTLKIVEEGYTYTLHPLSDTKSSFAKISTEIPIKLAEKGFFKK